MNYRIEVAGDASDLEEKVRECMKQGWRPVGGVSCMCYRYVDSRKGWDETDETWAQALTLEGPIADT